MTDYKEFNSQKLSYGISKGQKICVLQDGRIVYESEIFEENFPATEIVACSWVDADGRKVFGILFKQ